MVKSVIVLTTLSLAAAVTVGPTTQATASQIDLRVASFNVQSVSLDATEGEQRPWAQRRAGVVAAILGENLDVVGLQEVNPSHFWASRLVDGYNQFLDLKHGVNKAGGNYQLTNSYANNCVVPKTSYNCVRKYRGASGSDRILYNADRVQMVSQGSLRYTAQGTSQNQRYLAYAVLRMKATGSEFLFTTTHLDPTSLVTREAQWRQLIAKVNRLKGSRPVISVGDFNVQKNNDLARTMLPLMKTAGYGDVINQQYQVNPSVNPRALVRVNGWINSYNHLRRDVASFAYEDRRDKTGNGIDWIFATNSLKVKEWKVVLNYDPDSLQVIGILPSDHNMVRATVTLP